MQADCAIARSVALARHDADLAGTLHAAGLLRSPEDSTELESYGQPGRGRSVTIYANSGHAFMTIQGRRFDTVAQAQTGSRWSNHMVSTAGFVARHPTHY